LFSVPRADCSISRRASGPQRDADEEEDVIESNCEGCRLTSGKEKDAGSSAGALCKSYTVYARRSC